MTAAALPGARPAIPAFDGVEAVDLAPGQVVERQTRRWYGISSFALVALGVGVLATEAGLVLASAVGLAFAGYGRLTSPPPVDLDVERAIDDRSPDPGQEVAVSVRVRNDGDRTLRDLRLVDGVPPRLRVTEGSPRLGTVLGPGETATLTYAVAVDRGVHAFEPVSVAARDVSGATERISTVAVDDEVTCEPELPVPTVDVPLRAQTSPFTGRFPADSGGPGVEFYATREYRAGDPLNRVDWRRTARTGELTTVEYRVERTASVVLVVDARASAYVGPDAYARSAVEHSVEAAREVAASLLADGHDVGLAALSPTDCWLAPGRGEGHRAALREALATHPALSPVEPDADANLYAATQRLRQRLASDTQIVVFSPLTDPLLTGTVVRLDAHGHRATVVSPDATATDSTGHLLAAAERSVRIGDLRRRGVPVVDWDPDEPFHAAVERLRRGRSR